MRKRKIHNIRFYLIFLVLLILFASLIVSSLIVSLGSKLFKQLDFFNDSVWVSVITIFLASPIITFTLTYLMKPIPDLKDAMEKVAKGDFTISIKTNSKINDIKTTYESFNIMVKELQSTEILQTDFISNVSHEFKTPINAIEGYAMLLQGEGEQSEEQKEYIDKILQNTKRLTELMGGILLLSKIENQVIAPKKEYFRLDEQIRKAIVALELKWTKKNIDFDINMEEITYYSNNALLYHVWLNLIDNAIKFSYDGGLINITLQKQDNNILFIIKDQGEGINKEDISHIFDKFFQADSSHSIEGNGLGLTLVKRIININSGSISCTSCDGTTFSITLPIVSEG